MLPPDADRARLVRKLDELQSHVAAAWDASAKRQQQVVRQSEPPPSVPVGFGRLTSAHPSNLQSIQSNRPVTGASQAGQVDEILSGSQVSIPRRSLLEQLGLFIRGR
jgi:hypothetical protein